jgi:3'-phosphoadenosine 5'-phosphosulfate sulfotransferase (PAPS reductase)/FAD synthetase
MALELIKSVYRYLDWLFHSYPPNEWLWLVSYSGGKDSTTLLLLVLSYAADKDFKVSIVYNDCGGDLPKLRELIFKVLDAIKSHPKLLHAIDSVFVTRPDKSFFDYLLTKYSPPRWNFRWCCKRLKEYPFKKLVSKLAKERKVLNIVGNRREEARWRNWLVKKVSDRVTYVAPLRDLRNDEVWHLLKTVSSQLGFEWVYRRLLDIYRGGAIRRSGCWFCTLISPLNMLILEPKVLEIKLEILEAWCTGNRERIMELAKEYPELINITITRDKISYGYPCGKKCSICQVGKLRSLLKEFVNQIVENSYNALHITISNSYESPPIK